MSQQECDRREGSRLDATSTHSSRCSPMMLSLSMSAKSGAGCRKSEPCEKMSRRYTNTPLSCAVCRPPVKEPTSRACSWKANFQAEPSTCVTASPSTATPSADWRSHREPGGLRGQEYVTTARAKGLAEWVVILRHALTNALIPVVTIFGLQFGQQLTGTVVVETVFARPGLDRLIIDDILNKDFPMVQGVVLVVAVSYVLVNLLVDLMYAVLDPRIRYA